uniref:Chitin-binding type-2 domain-containing protein n=1 Tax=Anopheles atroparvus TaxID=41427 RepID=A0AAG5D191_ANOAO
MLLTVALLFTVFSLICERSLGQVSLRNGTALNTRAFVKQDCDGVKTYICDSCVSRRPCVGVQEINVSIPCATGSYCTTLTAGDRCGPIPSDECISSTASKPFTCTSLGVFPDPNNCNVYHVCLAAKDNSNVYKCAPGYVFDIASVGCIRQVLPTTCVTVRCAVGSPAYVLYGNSRQYYVICDGQNLPTQVMRCPNGSFFTFFSTTLPYGECVYSCTGQGNYPNSNNPISYFQCYISNGRLVYTEVDCPKNTVFNSTLRYCVLST